MRGRPDVGVLYRSIGGVQRRTGSRETTSFRGFGKAAAEGISSAAKSGFRGKPTFAFTQFEEAAPRSRQGWQRGVLSSLTKS